MLSETRSQQRRNWRHIIASTEVLRLAAGPDAVYEFRLGDAMISSSSARRVVNLGIASGLAVFLGACGSMSLPSFSSGPTPPPEPAVAPDMPATIRADEIAGR